ncbi:hypothetical protein NUU61_001902 [Penicillium alfredii]|uniref:Uncharacterized protein n=1 Tax=Penicillium alfredii TaxID=1506179 RepID=A0A9W9FR73_9EURO|nr:uncharacterized protein NUU61_001902 [Penicillium alfredii]KAJ5104555.1 hypothetical protein NUU61_001902 [Penicillium alfredii]
MVLVTSSTVSAVVSVGVICIFTLLLFLSGYVLQQQSVKNIQYALRPPDQRPGAGGGSTFQRPGRKRGPSDSDLGLAADPGIAQEDEDRHSGHEGNYAYLQLLSDPDPSNICSAILFFKQLAASETVVQDRLFMYPEEWDRMPSSKLGKTTSTALSILRTASIKYGIWLLPIDMSGTGRTPTDSRLLRQGQVQFMQYDSVLYVQTPGLLLDPTKLDDVLLSRPLPLRHNKDRVESYNNEAWIPMPLRSERDPDLPPVYLITVNSLENRRVEARTHIPNVALPGFGRIVTGPSGVKKLKKEHGPKPAYVYFEHDRDGRVKWAENSLFGTWRSQQSEVCEGLDFDDDTS